MPIDGMERVNFQIAVDNSSSQANDSASNLAHDVIHRMQQKAAEKQQGLSKDNQVADNRQTTSRETAPKFEAVFKGLLQGSQGGDKQKIAQLFNTPVFQNAPNSAKEEITEKISNGEVGYDSASSFGRLTGDDRANAALNSAEASGAVLRQYAKPKGDLAKVEGAVQEFIENFSGGDAGKDPKANARILNANLQAPGDDIMGLMNKGMGNKSFGAKNLGGLAKEAVASRALKEAFAGVKPGESVTKKILDKANDPSLMKKLGGGEMSKIAGLMARSPEAAVPIDDLLKSEKFFNMSSRVREGQVAFIGLQSNIGAFKGPTNLGAKLPDKLATLPRESKQMKALSALLAKKGEVDDEDLDEAISRARRKEISYPPQQEHPDPSDPNYQKSLGSELAQWMQLKQKTLQANRKVEQRIKGAKSGADLRQLEPLKSWQALDVSGRPPEIQAAVQKMNQEIEAELKKQRLTYSKQMKITRGVKADVSAVRERAPSTRPARTTFRLPENSDGVNTTFSLATLVSSDRAAAVEAAAASTSTTGVAAAPTTKNKGWGITLGMDRDRQFFSGKAVKAPTPAQVGAQTGAAPAGRASSTSTTATTFRKGGPIRNLDQMTQNRWIDLSVSERGALRTLQIDRRIFETLASDRPTMPSLMLKGWPELNRAQQTAAEDVGMSQLTWTQNRDNCLAVIGTAPTQRTASRDTKINLKNVQMKRNA